MVYDSPGFPLDHFLYAMALSVNDAGAMVLIDHPGNPSHGQQKFVPGAKLMTAADAEKFGAEAREAMSSERDSTKIKDLRAKAQHFDFVAEQLS